MPENDPYPSGREMRVRSARTRWLTKRVRDKQGRVPFWKRTASPYYTKLEIFPGPSPVMLFHDEPLNQEQRDGLRRSISDARYLARESAAALAPEAFRDASALSPDIVRMVEDHFDIDRDEITPRQIAALRGHWLQIEKGLLSPNLEIKIHDHLSIDENGRLDKSPASPHEPAKGTARRGFMVDGDQKLSLRLHSDSAFDPLAAERELIRGAAIAAANRLGRVRENLPATFTRAVTDANAFASFGLSLGQYRAHEAEARREAAQQRREERSLKREILDFIRNSSRFKPQDREEISKSLTERMEKVFWRPTLTTQLSRDDENRLLAGLSQLKSLDSRDDFNAAATALLEGRAAPASRSSSGHDRTSAPGESDEQRLRRQILDLGGSADRLAPQEVGMFSAHLKEEMDHSFSRGGLKPQDYGKALAELDRLNQPHFPPPSAAGSLAPSQNLHIQPQLPPNYAAAAVPSFQQAGPALQPSCPPLPPVPPPPINRNIEFDDAARARQAGRT